VVTAFYLKHWQAWHLDLKNDGLRPGSMAWANEETPQKQISIGPIA
jgi:hypothetical protein